MIPIHSARLTLRPMTHADVDLYVAYRSLPETLEYMDSRVPPTTEWIHAAVDENIAQGGPTPGAWYRLIAELTDTGETVGSLGAGIDRNGGMAELGFAWVPEHKRRGYASEAAGRLADHLISEHGIHRLWASLSPHNVPSMRVLEAIGMTFEVLAREAFCVDGEWEDDLRYAMTAADRRAWVDRPRHHPAAVDLVEIEPDEAYLWGRLATHYSEQRFVATMPMSWCDALFPETFEDVEAIPWMRGILADGERAGFVMLSLTHGHSEGWYLWRLLIDRMHQRRGIGRVALAHVLDELRQHGIPRLFTSYEEGIGTPLPFYLGLGFVPTGRIIDGEPELVLELA